MASHPTRVRGVSGRSRTASRRYRRADPGDHPADTRAQPVDGCAIRRSVRSRARPGHRGRPLSQPVSCEWRHTRPVSGVCRGGREPHRGATGEWTRHRQKRSTRVLFCWTGRVLHMSRFANFAKPRQSWPNFAGQNDWTCTFSVWHPGCRHYRGTTPVSQILLHSTTEQRSTRTETPVGCLSAPDPAAAAGAGQRKRSRQ